MMGHKTLVITTLFTVICATPALPQEAAPKPVTNITLREAISIAHLNNKAIQIKEDEIGIARARLTGARSGYLPKADVSYGYTYNAAVVRLPQAVVEGPKKDPGIFTGYENNNAATLTATEPIFDGGAAYANVKQAKVGVRVSEESLRAMKLDVEFETKRLYYGLMLAFETARIAQDLFDQAQAHYEDAKVKYEQGIVSRFDVLQSKVQVTKVMPELVRARNAIELIKADLRKLIGIKTDNDVFPAGVLSCEPVEIQEGLFLKEAFRNRPEMVLSLLGVDMKKWAIETAKATGMPQVNGTFDYTYLSNNVGRMFNYKHSNWNAGIAVTVPVFDGFSTVAKINEARRRYSQAGIERDDMRDQTEVDVKKACLDLKEANSIINSQKSGIEEAREALKISYISFDNGVGTNLDVLDAQVSLSQIEKNLAEAIYDYLMALAYLDRILGRPYREGRI